VDEGEARAILDGMWERLARGPHAALGLESGASAAEIRAAFLELSKVYHPTKFARMSSDIQRLSNEAFLALRAAHDTLAKSAKAVRAQPAPPGNGRAPGTPVRPPQPVAPAAGMRTTGAVPPLARTPASSQSLPRGAVPGARGLTPAQGVKVTGAIPTRPATKQTSGAIPALRNEDADLAAAKEALSRGAWNEAAATLEALVAAQPSDRGRALLAYTRGRQHLAAGNREDAREALFDARDLDPSLASIVEAALAEVQRRRS
jgi:hypothetical protein